MSIRRRGARRSRFDCIAGAALHKLLERLSEYAKMGSIKAVLQIAGTDLAVLMHEMGREGWRM
jgi:hypothetical protein